MAAYQVSAVQLNGGGYYLGCHVTLQLLLAQGSLAPVQIQVPDGIWDDDHHSDDNFACKTLTMTSTLFLVKSLLYGLVLSERLCSELRSEFLKEEHSVIHNPC